MIGDRTPEICVTFASSTTYSLYTVAAVIRQEKMSAPEQAIDVRDLRCNGLRKAI
jgi:hypothetical protein